MPGISSTSLAPTVEVEPSGMRPNIIFIIADDMEVSALEFMPQTTELLGSRGAMFTRFYVNNSLCCPSRATILRGQYMHNTNITGNKLPTGGFDKFRALGLEGNSFPVWLQQAGYSTALFGKYLNEYPGSAEPTYIPPGWTEWYSPVAGNPYRNFNYALNENGTFVQYGESAEDYATDVISRKAQDFIAQNVEAGIPFFAFVSVFAPHTPSAPAPRHEGLYHDLALPQPPSFDEDDISDKSQSFNELDHLSEKEIRKMEDLYRKRAESLLAVDELVSAIVKQVEELGQGDNTYIIFTSDNGYHMGQHRLVQGKNTPFEED
ncbi:MAG: sulfatase, partial [Anaerolineales bacterium]|nr:sulfatase [Anaerolineales bacterium]